MGTVGLLACTPDRSLAPVTRSVTPSQSATPSPSSTLTSIPSPTLTATSTPSPTATRTPTDTPTPTISPTPTVSPTPTFDFPDATVQEQAFCRYGPGKAYLPAGDLYEGDHGLVWNRNPSGTWLWVRFDKLSYACWVAASLTEVEGDVFTVAAYFPPLPKSTLYGPPQNVQAGRSGNQVTVTWNRVPMTDDDDRGYLIEARLCQDGLLFDTAVHTNETAITFEDHPGCEKQSSGKLYTVEKHGYTDPVTIPWPE